LFWGPPPPPPACSSLLLRLTFSQDDVARVQALLVLIIAQQSHRVKERGGVEAQGRRRREARAGRVWGRRWRVVGPAASCAHAWAGHVG